MIGVIYFFKMKYKIGDKIGRLTILDIAIKPVSPTRNRSFCLCECECGNKKWIMSCNLGLGLGRTRSCGCRRKDAQLENCRTHGQTNTAEYNTWCRIKARCLNPNSPRFSDYGGRGIKVCERWRDSFENFLEDMGERPSKEHSIDRIDVNGDYEPSNCRWATILEQGENRRSNIYLTYKGETHFIAEWARILGVTYATIYKRYKRGKSIEEIFNL